MESNDGECHQTHQRVPEGKKVSEAMGNSGTLICLSSGTTLRLENAVLAIFDFTKYRRFADSIEDSKDLLPEINKNIPADIHYDLKKRGTGFSSHIEISRKRQTNAHDGVEE